MSKQTEKGLPEAIERVREQFKEWRAHKSGRDRTWGMIHHRARWKAGGLPKLWLPWTYRSTVEALADV